MHDAVADALFNHLLPPKCGIQFLGNFGSLTQISFSLYLIYIYLYHASERKREEGIGSCLCSHPQKEIQETASKKQPPVSSPQALKHSFDIDDADSGSQAMNSNRLDDVMDILIDISSQFKAIERGIELLKGDRTARRLQSPSISWQTTRTT